MRRMMLAAGVITSAAGGGTTTPTRTPFSLPDRDARTLALRPSKTAVAQVVVAQDGTGDYTSLAAAFAAINDIRTDGAAAHGQTGTADANNRVDIALAPGTYAGAVPIIPAHIGVYALSATDTTRIEWGLENDGPFYWEGVDITNVDNAGAFDPKYPIHMHANPNAPLSITCCALNNAAPNAGGYPTTVGMDGVAGGTLVLHRTNLQTGGTTNLHGPGPVNIIFSEVTTTGVALWYNAMSDSTTDQMWVKDCTASGVYLGGDSTTLHVSGGNPGTITHVANDGTTTAAGVTDSDDNIPWPGATTVV